MLWLYATVIRYFETSILSFLLDTLNIYIFLFFIFIHNKGINIHMTYNNNDNNQSKIITMSLCL